MFGAFEAYFTVIISLSYVKKLKVPLGQKSDHPVLFSIAVRLSWENR